MVAILELQVIKLVKEKIDKHNYMGLSPTSLNTAGSQTRTPPQKAA